MIIDMDFSVFYVHCLRRFPQENISLLDLLNAKFRHDTKTGHRVTETYRTKEVRESNREEIGSPMRGSAVEKYVICE
jgi:hypothetical protein